MGRMHIITQCFFISKAYHAAAFAALIGGQTELIEEYQNLEGLMAASNWPVDMDADGNIVSIRCDAAMYSGIELRFFAALAPFVRAGSFMLCLLDTADPMLWIFDGVHVRQQTGAALANRLATILSHTLVSDCGPHTAVADRVQARFNAYRAVTAILAEGYHELPDTYAPDEPEAQADARYHSTEEEDAIVAQVRGLEQQVAQLQRQVATPLHIVVDIQGQEIQLLLRPVLHTARPPSSMYPSAKRYVEQLPALSDKEHACHAINLCSLALLLHAPISLTAIH